jgi:hypothetical protein
MEEEVKRPGGLTAMAVINFIIAGFSVIGIIGTVFSMTMIGNVPTNGMPEAAKAQIEALQRIDPSVFAIMIGMNVISFLLLLLSGIGYLKQKKVLGRFFGNVYGFYGIIGVIISTLILPKAISGGLGVMSFIGIIYPIITLILLDTVFKNDLNN